MAADAAPTQVLATAPAPPGGRPGRRTALIAAALVVLAALGGLLAWAVTRPSSPAPAGVTTGSVPETAKTHAHTGTSTPPTTTTAQTQSTQETTTRRQTTTAATTQIPSTTIPTTTPTETLPTTTLPTTTLPTTTVGTGATGTLSRSSTR